MNGDVCLWFSLIAFALEFVPRANQNGLNYFRALVNVLWPVQCEVLLSMGISAASANSLTTLLRRSNDPIHGSNLDGFTSDGVGSDGSNGVGDQPYVFTRILIYVR